MISKEFAEKFLSQVVIGEAAGGMVKIEYNLKSGFIKADIDPSLFKAQDPKFVSDLFVAAANSALMKIGEAMIAAAKEQTSSISPELLGDFDLDFDPKKFN